MSILRNLLSVILVHNTRSRARAQRHLWRENRLQFEVLERRWAPAVTFGVIGDYGVDNSNELAVANLVKSWNPDFVITTGDNGYNTTVADIDRFIGKYYQQFIGNYQGSYGPGAGAVNKFFPSAGNHDWDGGGGTLTPYTNYFTLPGNERYYDFVRGDVHFFVVSSDPREPGGLSVGSVQQQWLQSRLAASTAPWQVVYMHHPPYSSGANHGSTAAMQWPYQQWGADVVLAAHDHTYERIIRNDANNSNFPYFVNGTGGNSLYSFSTPVAGSQVRYSANWGAMRVTADATRMTFEFINVAGNVIDTYTISNAALPAVSIAATDANASEPGANTGAFNISRTGPTTNPLTVNYTRGGTATNAADYAALSGTVVIPAGAASAVITLTPLNDALVEGSETAILTLSASGAYTIGASSSATVTIADDDVASLPTVTIAATDANASEPGANTGAFNISRTGPTTNPLTVNYTRGGTATNAADYAALSGTVVIPAGAASAVITLTPLNDALVEGSETAILTLSASGAYTIGASSSATVTIADDDVASLPTVTIAATDANASEPGANTGAFNISRTGPTTNPLTVNYTRGGTATNAADYAALSGTVVIPAGAASAVITLTPLNDALVEGSETAILTLSASGAYTIGASSSATVTIADDDVSTVTIAATDANASEPANTGTFTVSRTGSTTAAMTVNYTVNGTATRGSDYTNLSGVVTIPAGAALATIIVTPINDTLVEANETVLLALAAGAGYAIGSPNNATVTIADDDAPPTPEIVVEGNSVSIADGHKKPSSADHTDFGAAAVGGAPISRTFTIRNAGTGPLNVGQVTVPAGFTLTALPASNVAAGGTTQFTVRLDTATAGTESGDVSFGTNDSNENPFNFRITGKVGTGSAIASFTLINADTDGAIRTIMDGDTINLAGLPTTRLNIRANTNAGPIESVRFGFDGNNNYLVDNLPPYALFSDQAGNYHPGTLSVGSHTLSATPFAADNASGNQGVPLSIAFSVINSATFFGDYNQDGIVDAADYVVWRKTFGATGLQPYSGADGNGDGDVDLDDLAVWKAHFGKRVAPPGSGSGTVAASSPSTPGEVPQETASAMVATQDSAGPEAPYEISPIPATPPVANAPAEMDSETTAAAESQSQVTAADETITTDDQSAVFDAAVEQSPVAHDEALVSFRPSISFATNQPIDTDPRETRSARTVFAPTAALISGRETIVASRRTQRALVASREIWTDIAVDKLLLLPAALSTDEKADLESALPRPARRHEHMTHAPALDDVYDDLERDSWRRHRAKTPMAVV